jgi:hypothetical protein
MSERAIAGMNNPEYIPLKSEDKKMKTLVQLYPNWSSERFIFAGVAGAALVFGVYKARNLRAVTKSFTTGSLTRVPKNIIPFTVRVNHNWWEVGVNMAANDVSKNIIKFSQPEQKKLFSMMQQSDNKFIMLNGTPVKLAEYVGDESGKIFLGVAIAIINVLFFSTIH